MAMIQKRKSSYRAQVEMKNRATGLMHRESKSFPTMREAEDWAQALEADLKRAQHNDTRLLDATPLRDLIQRYIDEVSLKKLGAKQEIVRLKAWLRHPLADRPISRCLPKDFADHIAQRRKDKSKRGGGVAEQTIKHELIAISNVFESARRDWGYAIENPTKKISKPGGSQARDVRIPPDIWPKLSDELRKCRNKQYVVIAEFAIETGMREDELMRMAWRDLDKARRIVEVWGKDTSSRSGQRKKRLVPLSPRAMELLGTLPQALDSSALVFQTVRKTSADGLSRAFTSACKKIGIEGGVFHCTRHEAASRMAPHYPMLTLMAIMGWKTPAMAARYYHAGVDELHAGIERMQAAR
jgi:integrase